jgi:CRISPR-associated protein Cas2
MSSPQRSSPFDWLAQFKALWHRLLKGNNAKPTPASAPPIDSAHALNALELRTSTLLAQAQPLATLPHETKPHAPENTLDTQTPTAHIQTPTPLQDTTELTFRIDEETVRQSEAFLAQVRAQLAKPAKPPMPRTRRPRKPQPSAQEIRERKLLQALEHINAIVAHKKEHMLYLVMYDIESNPLRTRFANYLEEMGLRRVQRSVFMGELDRRLFTLVHHAAKEMQASYDNQDSIIFLPISNDEAYNMQLVGKELDIDFILYRHHTLFF